MLSLDEFRVKIIKRLWVRNTWIEIASGQSWTIGVVSLVTVGVVLLSAVRVLYVIHTCQLKEM